MQKVTLEIRVGTGGAPEPEAVLRLRFGAALNRPCQDGVWFRGAAVSSSRAERISDSPRGIMRLSVKAKKVLFSASMLTPSSHRISFPAPSLFSQTRR